MRKVRDLELQNDSPRREAVIRKLMTEHGVTHRMIERCLAEFLPDIRLETARLRHAMEGIGEIRPLRKTKKKRKPGVYADKKLRLIVDSAGNHKWIFRFIWRSTVRDMVLGHSKMSLAVARELATKARRMVTEGQNPIGGSWLSAALESVKSKS
jgi:hypothetical protein